MEEILKNAMNGKELDLDELQKVTGGVMIDASQVAALMNEHCYSCKYENKNTECMSYLGTVITALQNAGPGGKVDVSCPKGLVKL